MAGLYVHIPFCKSRCIYCGFYSTTLTRLADEYVEAVCTELNGLAGDPWHRRLLETTETVYLGGGTPSQLSTALLGRLFDAIAKTCGPLDAMEVTIECNPDDLTPQYVKELSCLPVNRVSMGAQTFSDERLRFLHRRHKSSQVGEAVTMLREAGIGNISIDLMFGFPGETLEEWEADIHEALGLQVEHISAYGLMTEEGTELCRLMQEGKVKEIDEDLSLRMYETIIDRLTAAGYEHYEISNFALPGHHSRHNSSYWDGTPYIGIGAAAHSYDVDTRWWNVSDVRQYISRMKAGESAVEEREVLSKATRYDDTVMTALRTRRGLRIDHVEQQFGHEMKDYLMANALPHLQASRLTMENGWLRLTRQGLFVSDSVMADLMFV